MKRLSVISTALIITGCICIAVPFVIEAVNYPWGSLRDGNVNDVVLPDPPPPDFDDFDYTEYTETDGAGAAGLSVQSIEAAEESFIQTDFEEPPVSQAPEVDETTPETPAPAAPAKPVRPNYVLLGSVKIPRINISENLFEGTEKQMRYGIGHLEGTPLPGSRGNAVIAGHRVSSVGKHPFRHLDKMRDGDVISVKVGEEAFTYEIFDVFIVSRDDLWILQPSADEPYMLTLVTCDPVVSAAPRENRLVARARLVI